MNIKKNYENAIAAVWVFCFVLNIAIMMFYRIYAVGGQRIILRDNINELFVNILSAFLAPLTSIVIFYAMDRNIEGVTQSVFISSSTLFISLTTNIIYVMYVLSPVIYGLPAGDDVLTIYGEASMIAGLMNIAIVGPLIAFVFSSSGK